MADEDYLDDELAEEEDDFEEFDEDFEAAGAQEAKIKCVSGMDTFAVVWSFFATLIALCILSWVILYEVYDDRIGGILPQREKPLPQNKIRVISFGRDTDVSDQYNYAILNIGKASGVVPGTVIWFGDPGAGSTPRAAGDVWVKMIVSEDCEADICKAMIVDVRTPVMTGGESENVSVAAPNLERHADQWDQIDNRTEAVKNLPLLLMLSPGGGEAEIGKSSAFAAMAPWDSQEIIKTVETKFANHIRVERKSSK